MQKQKIVVTGGSGKVGRAAITELLRHGYDVLSIDRQTPAERPCPFLAVDLTSYAEVVDALSGAWGVVHLGAIPAPGLVPPERTFRENTLGAFNVFQAAALHKLARVVSASSETALGVPFSNTAPLFAPIDESHYPHPQSTYALSKVVGETVAAEFARWTGIPIVSLRFSNVLTPEDYVTRLPTWQDDPHLRKRNLWGYIDVRDAAQACRLGLEAELAGPESFMIAAADTVMRRPNAELLAACFPGVRLTREVGPHETLLSIERARRLLGFAPAHTWRESTSS